MKHAKKPTYSQRKILLDNGYDPSAWLVERDTTTEIVIVARGETKTVTIKKD